MLKIYNIISLFIKQCSLINDNNTKYFFFITDNLLLINTLIIFSIIWVQFDN